MKRFIREQECIPEEGGYYALLIMKEEKRMITFVGAGPGAEDLITVRGQNKLQASGSVVIYAGSLVNPALLKMCREEVCRL